MWATANNNNNNSRGSHLPGFHFFTPRGGTAAGGGLKGWVVDKKTACRGVTAGPGPASMDVNESPSPHIAINTYSTNKAGGSNRGNLQISISKPRHYKGIKVHAL